MKLNPELPTSPNSSLAPGPAVPRTSRHRAARLMAMFQLPEDQAAQVAPLVAVSLIANYAGDEAPDAQTQAVINGLMGSPEPMHTLGLVLWGLWTDLPPEDGELTLPFTAN